MSAGKYEIEITGDGNAAPEWIGSLENVQVENGKTASVKIEAVRGGFLEIAAVDAAGKPIAAAASVRVSPAQDVRIASHAVIDQGGAARLCLAGGEYVIVELSATGYLYKRQEGKPLTVESGKTTRVAVTLTPAPPIVLAVSDSAGKPVPGAKGKVMPLLGPGKDVVADPNGRLAIAPADVGPFFCFVLVRHPTKNLVDLVAVAKEEAPPRVVLRAPVKIAGTVKDAKGNPLPGATVQAQIDASHMGRYGIVASCLADKAGRYVLDVPNFSAQYAVSARAAGFSEAEVMINQPEIAEAVGGQIAKDLTLRAASRTLRGVVKDAAGKPVPGAVVTARASATHIYPGSGVTDAEGRFVLDGLDDEPCIYVQAGAPGRGWVGTGTVKPGDKEISITVGPSHWD